MSRESIDDRRLLRYLHGELDAAQARELEQAFEADPELHRRYQRLRRIWSSLEAPPASPVPEDFSSGVMAEVRRLPASGAPQPASAWGRLAAVSMLGVGLGLGLGLGQLPPREPQEEVFLVAEPPSLAAGYWLALAEEDGWAPLEDEL